jgi:hypothetical protein
MNPSVFKTCPECPVTEGIPLPEDIVAEAIDAYVVKYPVAPEIVPRFI